VPVSLRCFAQGGLWPGIARHAAFYLDGDRASQPGQRILAVWFKGQQRDASGAPRTMGQRQQAMTCVPLIGWGAWPLRSL
jgi:hypothetical protein